MLHTRRFLFLLTSLWICLFALSGCGGKKSVTVKGKLVLPSGIKLDKTDVIQLTFVPENSRGVAAGAKPSLPDLTFVAKDSSDKGIAVGKYKVTFKIDAYAGMPDSQKRSVTFQEVNQSYNLLKSKLTYEVTEDEEQNITIDLAKGTITKN